MQQHTIVILDKLYLEDSHIKRLKKVGTLMRFQDDWPDERESIIRAEKATILVSKWVYISPKIIRNAHTLQYAVLAMTGYQDWVDIEAARSCNILVSNVPNFSTEAVAEHAIMLMLTVAKKLNPSFLDVQKGLFNPKDERYRGFELQGKKLGIVGYGNIGKRIAQIARSIGMHVCSINSSSTRIELETLLKQSDIVSLNIPFTPQTSHMICAKELSLLASGAIIINTSRGKVIDEKALINALKSGHIAGAGLDVLEDEPPAKTNQLLTMENVVITPHIAYATGETFVRLADGVVSNIEAFAAGKPINVVT